jgi:hypothetical protein
MDYDFFRDYDAFAEDARQFEEDVHLLVLGTFNAAQAHWSGRLDVELPKIEAMIKSAKNDGYAQHLVDEHTDELARYSEQVRFSLNTAVVSLVTLFIDTIRRMYRHLDITIPRLQGRYPGKTEVSRLRSEALGRFGIKDSDWDQRMAFIEPFVLARNLIVHNEGEADTLLLDGTKDQDFRISNPEWVDHYGRVAIPEKAVNDHVQVSVEVLRWIAAQLRARELQTQQATNA